MAAAHGAAGSRSLSHRTSSATCNEVVLEVVPVNVADGLFMPCGMPDSPLFMPSMLALSASSMSLALAWLWSRCRWWVSWCTVLLRESTWGGWVEEVGECVGRRWVSGRGGSSRGMRLGGAASG